MKQDALFCFLSISVCVNKIKKNLLFGKWSGIAVKNQKLSNCYSPEQIRASSFSASSGAMTVEASFALSFFLMFMIQIFFLIFGFLQYGVSLEQLHQKGKQIAAYGYSMGSGAYYDDAFSLRDSVKIPSLFGIFTLPVHQIPSYCYIKPWTGYGLLGNTEQEEEEMVYITENGTVYHRSRSCTHLALSIQITDIHTIKNQKNSSNGKYHPCEKCGNNPMATALYITQYGDKYHTCIQCSGLKRTIKAVPLKQVEGWPACSKCGG